MSNTSDCSQNEQILTKTQVLLFLAHIWLPKREFPVAYENSLLWNLLKTQANVCLASTWQPISAYRLGSCFYDFMFLRSSQTHKPTHTLPLFISPPLITFILFSVSCHILSTDVDPTYFLGFSVRSNWLLLGVSRVPHSHQPNNQRTLFEESTSCQNTWKREPF